ncbi:MAG: iron-containing alcohol dehydrogenase [Chloroflexi bacterium]|nr:iron-containing alcohol dehydrogenase [Chloroflexota bacterium]
MNRSTPFELKRLQDGWRFSVNTAVDIGIDSVQRLPDTLQKFGFEKVGIVLDNGVTGNPAWEKAYQAVRDRFRVVQVLESGVSEPDYDYLDECKQYFNGKEIDCLIGVGGGSILDLAKALSVLITNPGPAIEYRGFNLIKNPGPPLIAIPTTAGTGSEVTPNAVFIDKKEMRKFGINTSMYLPKLVLLDPLMTVTCPRPVTISSGMDALVHAVESYVAKGATPTSRIFSREAFALVFNNLSRVVDEPDNLEWRGRMQVGAYYAGTALMNAGAGPAGAMSYPLGVHFRVPHGLAGAVFLPEVVAYNVDRGCTVYGELYDLIEDADPGLTLEEKSERFAQRLRQLCDYLGIPKTLDRFGMSRADIEMFGEQTTWLKAALDQNPASFSIGEVKMLLDRMLPLEVGG